MANPEHVAKLKEGMNAWNAWRKTTDEKPDLSRIVLKETEMVAYNLEGDDFSGAILEGVTFLGSIAVSPRSKEQTLCR